MSITLNRRDLIAGSLTSLVAPARLIAAQNTIAAIETRNGGRLGLFAIDIESQHVLAHREDERFLMCSTFKGALVALVLRRIDAGQDKLDRLIPYNSSDILAASPVTKANRKQGAMSVKALCAAAMIYSDNTAALLLTRNVGGPAALTAFYRSLGDNVTRSDRYEPEANQPNGLLDTTTPRAMAGMVRKIILGDVLRPAFLQLFVTWLIDCKTGLDRLRASFPSRWIAGDRTGTGDTESNDYAFIQRPGQSPLFVAAYYEALHLTADQRNGVLAEAGAAIVVWNG